MHTLEQKERHVSIWNMKWGSMIDGLEYCTGRKKSPVNLNSVSRVVKFPEVIFYLFKYTYLFSTEHAAEH